MSTLHELFIGWLGLLQALAVVLKLAGVLEASWFATFFVLWGGALLTILCLSLFCTMSAAYCYLDWDSMR